MRAAYICRSFAPLNNIASIRHSKLVKYLVRKGWQVTVFAEEIDEREIIDPRLFCKEFEQINIIRLPNRRKDDAYLSKTTKKPKLGETKISTQKRSWLYKFTRSTWLFIKEITYDRNYFYKFRQALDSLDSVNEFDLIFSSYMPMGAHWAASYLKRNQARQAVWIADFRDLANDGKNFPFILRAVMSALQANICNRADGVTLVSNGLRERIMAQRLVRKNRASFITLTNGFDPDDIPDISPVQTIRKTLTICYTGQVIPGSRNASMLFEAISELLNNRSINPDSIDLVYAGPANSHSSLYEQAHAYGVENLITNHGYIKHSQALILQKNSDLLLLLTSNHSNKGGILTGKLMEYIGMDRPIIALITGDTKNSEVSQILGENGFGSSYYYLDKDQAKEDLKSYLLKCICQKEKDGYIHSEATRVSSASFSYLIIINELILFFGELASLKQSANDR